MLEYNKIKKSHKRFNLFAIVIGILSLIDIVIYNVFNYLQINPKGQYLTKIIPVSLFFLLPIIHQMLYTINIYSFLTSIALIFCWIGDFLLLFYSPENNFLIFGGISFFSARCIWILALMLFPEKECSFLKYKTKSLIETFLFATVIYTGFGLFFYFNCPDNILSVLVLIYFILGFGPPVALAYLRIKKLSQETIRGTVLSFAGLLCFNFSDTLLFFSLLSGIIPLKWSFLSNNIYWAAMYLLSLSVSRENFVNMFDLLY